MKRTQNIPEELVKHHDWLGSGSLRRWGFGNQGFDYPG